MGKMVFLNDGLIDSANAHVNIYDHGFLYGDGAFEGIRVYNRRIFRLCEHVDRLYRSCKAMAITLRFDSDRMYDAVIETAKVNDVQSGYIRLTVTRGTGLGLDPKAISTPSTIVISTEQLRLYTPSDYEKGLTVITASTRVPPSCCIDPQIKSLGKYINSITAKMEANRVGAGEALMLNMEGYVAEATGDNLFLVIGNQLITPPTSHGALPGITRKAVIEIAPELHLAVVEGPVTLYDCYNADEAFLTGTAAEVIAMVSLDGRLIGNGKPGPITKQIIDKFRERTTQDGPTY